jgi:hypothetical protein
MFTPHWNHLLQLLPWRKARVRRAAAHHEDSSLPCDEEDRPLGCGWFDSSHDLQQGLQVGEADSRALAQLPLADWLTFEMMLQARPCYEVDTSLDEGAGMIVDPTLH